jgi:hypothetical protein
MKHGVDLGEAKAGLWWRSMRSLTRQIVGRYKSELPYFVAREADLPEPKSLWSNTVADW